jgi:hypothetical protein
MEFSPRIYRVPKNNLSTSNFYEMWQVEIFLWVGSCLVNIWEPLKLRVMWASSSGIITGADLQSSHWALTEGWLLTFGCLMLNTKEWWIWTILVYTPISPCNETLPFNLENIYGPWHSDHDQKKLFALILTDAPRDTDRQPLSSPFPQIPILKREVGHCPWCICFLDRIMMASWIKVSQVKQESHSCVKVLGASAY